MLLTYKENVHSTQMYIPLKPLFSRHKGIGVQFIDEPTSALDPEMVGEVLDLIRELAREGMTMVIVTHEMGFAREVSTRVLFMDDGCVMEQNEPHALFASPQNPRLKSFLSKVL